MRQATTQDGRAPAQTGTPALAEQVDQYLTFVLGGEVFAIGILGIKEIIEYTHLTTVPMTPEYVRESSICAAPWCPCWICWRDSGSRRAP